MRILLCLTLAFAAIPSAAQSPVDGYIQGEHYINNFLHFSYAWPVMFQPVVLPPHIQNPEHSSPNEVALFAARQGSEPFGVIVISEKLNAPTASDPKGFRDGAHFLSHIAPTWKSDSSFRILNKKHFVDPHGLIFDELDYFVANEYSAGVTMQTKNGYLVVWKFNAKSAVELGSMTASARATTLFP